MRSRLLRYGIGILTAGISASGLATLLMFPFDIDPAQDQTPQSKEFYAKAYTAAITEKSSNSKTPEPLSEKEQAYVNSARYMADFYHVPDLVHNFVQDYGLADKKSLEVGAGSGLLQDQVGDYTGLDISSTARRFFHKPFVEASATNMPFPDATFDGLWTIWVLEHIPNPELALQEMRRVTKPGGYMLVYPALDVSRFSAHGLHARPYADLGWKDMFYKSLIPIADGKPFHLLYFHQVRALRSLAVHLGAGPSLLHFTHLEANYDQYWEGDSDATTSVSNHELYLWFKTRGDTCLNCPSEARLTFRDPPVPFLIIRKALRQ
ncbi:MAG: class I SAM-dependent methyltransferase [Acidobacteriota bacterium]